MAALAWTVYEQVMQGGYLGLVLQSMLAFYEREGTTLVTLEKSML